MRRRNDKVERPSSGSGARPSTAEAAAAARAKAAAAALAAQEEAAAMSKENPKVYLREALSDGLMRSKTPYSMWGREVFRALEVDDAFRMLRVFADKAYLGAHLDAQTTHEGYGGYVWTPWIHNFLGDTLLHIAIKLKKMKCIGYLLYSGARTDVPNYEGLTAETIAPMVGAMRCLNDLRIGSIKEMLQKLPLSDFDKIPDEFLHRNIEAEAWRLMHEGRTVYTELPKCYNRDKPRFASHSQPNSTAAMWTANSAWDTIELIRRQASRYRHVEHERAQHMSGLRSEKVKHLQLTEQSDDLFHKYYRKLGQTPGFRHLRFVGWSVAQKDAAQSREDDAGGAGDDNSSYAGRSAVGGPTLHDMEEKLPTRYITTISTLTNFKSVHLGVEEMKGLAVVLRRDPVITDLTLFSAHLCDDAVIALCKGIGSMEALAHLDLSHNAITDKSCAAIGKAVEQSKSLKKLNLRANRIGNEGAQSLVSKWSTTAACSYLNLSKNKISKDVAEEFREAFPKPRGLEAPENDKVVDGTPSPESLPEPDAQSPPVLVVVLQPQEGGADSAGDVAPSSHDEVAVADEKEGEIREEEEKKNDVSLRGIEDDVNEATGNKILVL